MGQMSTATSKLKKAKFLEHYAESGNVSQTCRALEISRNTIKYWLEHDKKFHAAYEQAQVVAVESLEQEAWTRAKAHSDLLLIFLLKGLRPERYRDNYQGPGGTTPHASREELLSEIHGKLARIAQRTGTPQPPQEPDGGTA